MALAAEPEGGTGPVIPTWTVHDRMKKAREDAGFYLDEYAWRYNHRNDRQAMFFTLLGNVTPAQ